MTESRALPVYTISTAAALLHVSVPTLRMYEREGLIIPYKKSSKQRRYSQNDIDRLRWIRAAINHDKISIEGIKRMMSLIPCWSIMNCSEKDREHCTAFGGSAMPCWTYNHLQNICADGECRTCPVYTGFSGVGRMKEHMQILTIQ